MNTSTPATRLYSVSYSVTEQDESGYVSRKYLDKIVEAEDAPAAGRKVFRETGADISMVVECRVGNGTWGEK